MTVPFAANILLIVAIAQHLNIKWQRTIITIAFLSLVLVRVAKFQYNSLDIASTQDLIFESFNKTTLNQNATNMAFHFINKPYSFPFEDYKKLSELTYYNWSFFTPRYYKSLKYKSLKDLNSAIKNDCHKVNIYLEGINIELLHKAIATFFEKDSVFTIQHHENFIIAQLRDKNCSEN